MVEYMHSRKYFRQKLNIHMLLNKSFTWTVLSLGFIVNHVTKESIFTKTHISCIVSIYSLKALKYLKSKNVKKKDRTNFML